jgi:hypothetical protein
LGVSVTIQTGGSGQFDVLHDGALVYSKHAREQFTALAGDRGFPDEAKVVEAIRARIGS